MGRAGEVGGVGVCPGAVFLLPPEGHVCAVKTLGVSIGQKGKVPEAVSVARGHWPPRAAGRCPRGQVSKGKNVLRRAGGSSDHAAGIMGSHCTEHTPVTVIVPHQSAREGDRVQLYHTLV